MPDESSDDARFSWRTRSRSDSADQRRQPEKGGTCEYFNDVIDDETGLSNARAFVRDLDYEIARSNRYKNAFSVASLDFAAEQFAGLKPKQRAAVWSELGTMLRESVRNTDRSAVSRSSADARRDTP